MYNEERLNEALLSYICFLKGGEIYWYMIYYISFIISTVLLWIRKLFLWRLIIMKWIFREWNILFKTSEECILNLCNYVSTLYAMVYLKKFIKKFVIHYIIEKKYCMQLRKLGFVVTSNLHLSQILLKYFAVFSVNDGHRCHHLPLFKQEKLFSKFYNLKSL